MYKKYQVFISSTYSDLINERATVIESILKLEHIPLGMEAFTATNREQMDLIYSAIKSSDYYVLVIGERYGTIMGGSGKSFTEIEYDYALKLGKPILSFVKKVITSDLSLEDFKTKVLNNHKNSGFWENKDELAKEVAIALVKEMEHSPQAGWVKGNELYDFTIGENNPLLMPNSNPTISDATNSIFVSGIGIDNMHSISYELKKLDSSVELIFAASDFKNDEVFKAIKSYFDFSDDILLMRRRLYEEAIKDIQQDRSVEILSLDSFFPIAYVAVDYKKITGSSFIQARHYFSPTIKDKFESYFILEKPGAKLYEKYLEQIKLITDH